MITDQNRQVKCDFIIFIYDNNMVENIQLQLSSMGIYFCHKTSDL